MKIAVLTANLGAFDVDVENAKQDLPSGVRMAFFRWTDKNFPPITGLTPRLQYRIPKLFGWEMFPGYDYYLWLDGSMTMQRPDSVKWFLDKIGDKELAVFKHPWRKTIDEEVFHIEDHLRKGKPYITSRYKNGLHLDQMYYIHDDPAYSDTKLYTSTVFLYKNSQRVRDMMKQWWYYQSRYYTCDQVVFPYVIDKSRVKFNVIQENQFKIPYLTLTSHH